MTTISKPLPKKVSVCIVTGCFGPQNFGFEKGKPLYCSRHKTSECINMTRKMCEVPTCTTFASFGTTSKKPLFCKHHKREGDMNVIKESFRARKIKSLEMKKEVLESDVLPIDAMPLPIFSFDEDEFDLDWTFSKQAFQPFETSW